MRTQVGIVGAGPAGLMLSHLLHLAGISSIVIEDRSRAYCEARVRAGLMENWVAQMLIDTGVGERLQREAMVHDGIYISFKRRGAPHRLPQADRQAGVHLRPEGGRHRPDRQAARRRRPDFLRGFGHQRSRFRWRQRRKSASATTARRRRSNAISSAAATASTASAGRAFRPACSRTTTGSIRSAGSASCRSRRRRIDELIYCFHERGFALFSMRGPELSRLYLQVPPDEDIEQWPDARIWDELETRLGGVRPLKRGKIVQKGITPMRSFVTEPMQSGRLFLAGDAAHIVPPTGAKGMNLAMADVRVLSRAIEAHVTIRPRGFAEGLFRDLSQPRVEGSALLLVDDADAAPSHDDDGFRHKRQIAEIDYVDRLAGGDDVARGELCADCRCASYAVASCVASYARVDRIGIRDYRGHRRVIAPSAADRNGRGVIRLRCVDWPLPVYVLGTYSLLDACGLRSDGL